MFFCVSVGKGEGMIIMFYVVGYFLGGIIWKIIKDIEEIIYVVDFNYCKERLVFVIEVGFFLFIYE